MYEAKHSHVLNEFMTLQETAKVLDADLSQLSKEELLAIVAYIGAECIILEDRHAVLEAALGPPIEELNKNRGVKLLKISRLLRRPEEGPDASVAFRALKKYYELAADAQAFHLGQPVTNRRNKRLLNVVWAAAEESQTVSQNPKLRPEARDQARTHSQLVSAWWSRMLKSASNHALAFPAVVAGLLGVKLAAGGAAAGGSAPAVGGGILGLSVTTQIAAGATVIALATTVVVASDPVVEKPPPRASSTVAQDYQERREERAGRGPFPYETRRTRPPEGLPFALPTSPIDEVPPEGGMPTASPTPETSLTASEEPPVTVMDLMPILGSADRPTPSASPAPSVTRKKPVKPAATKTPVPVMTLSPTEAPETSTAPTPTATPTRTSPSTDNGAVDRSAAPEIPVELPSGGPSEAPVPPAGRPAPAPVTTPSGLLDDLLHLAKTIL